MLARSTAVALLALPLLAQQVAAHAAIIEPWTRAPGDKSREVCGQQWNDDRNGVANANTKMGQIAPNDLANNKLPDGCDWRLCGGAQFEDNADHVYTWEAGTEVPITVFALNRHGGVANVSVVDTATNTVIGEPLKSWDDGKYLEYDFSNTCPNYPPLDETSFNISIPLLADKCIIPGACVIQWYWYSEAANNQTFESCIDFVQPYGGSAPAASVTDSPSTTSWYRYCSPMTTTIDYWSAALSIPLAINTQFANFATDVVTSASAALASGLSSAAGSSSLAAVTGSSAVTSDAAMATNTASAGSSAGSASSVQATAKAEASSAIVSTATTMPGSPSATVVVVSSSAVESAASAAVSLAAVPADSSSSAVAVTLDISSAIAAAASVIQTSSSAVPSALSSSAASSQSKTACRVRPASASLVSSPSASTPAAAAAASSQTADPSPAVVANAAAVVSDAASSACAGVSTVTVTQTTTATVYVELVAVGTSTVAGAVSQTLEPVATEGVQRRVPNGHGALKRRSLH